MLHGSAANLFVRVPVPALFGHQLHKHFDRKILAAVVEEEGLGPVTTGPHPRRPKFHAAHCSSLVGHWLRRIYWTCPASGEVLEPESRGKSGLGIKISKLQFFKNKPNRSGQKKVAVIMKITNLLRNKNFKSRTQTKSIVVKNGNIFSF